MNVHRSDISLGQKTKYAFKALTVSSCLHSSHIIGSTPEFGYATTKYSTFKFVIGCRHSFLYCCCVLSLIYYKCRLWFYKQLISLETMNKLSIFSAYSRFRWESRLSVLCLYSGIMHQETRTAEKWSVLSGNNRGGKKLQAFMSPAVSSWKTIPWAYNNRSPLFSRE